MSVIVCSLLLSLMSVGLGRTTKQSHLFGSCPCTAFLPVLPHCPNARQNRCQEDLNSSPLENWRRPPGRHPSYYVDEDCPARPEIQ